MISFRKYKADSTMKTYQVFLTILITLPCIYSQNFDTLGEQIVYYPASLMLSYHSRFLFFFNDTKLLNVAMQLPAVEGSKTPNLSTQSCSPSQARFLTKILESISKIKQVAHRLLSLTEYSNLLECDNYLPCYFEYSVGLTPRMTCPRAYRKSILECKECASKTVRA